MTARALMVQGTGSDVGKSLIVAGLARAFADRGLKVRPFKPQNMSNNAAVTADGGEIGRAQALQARAARVAPSVHMNPVLLKPQSEIGAQIVVRGKVYGTAQAAGWASLGLVPFFPDAYLLPAEDALALARAAPRRNGRITIAVPILPHIANFDDLDPLATEPVVDLVHVKPGSVLPGDADLIILPGSKATIADLAALRAAGFDVDIAAHARRGGRVLGLSGGYQMPGRRVSDPGGPEGKPGTRAGLGLLDVATVLSEGKRL